jgi:hypothetical protein
MASPGAKGPTQRLNYNMGADGKKVSASIADKACEALVLV